MRPRIDPGEGLPYVALGDSFAAGIGSQTSGHRTRRAGGCPVLVAQDLGLDLAYEAGHAMTVEDVLARQVNTVGPGTRLVTLTVGAYDAAYADVLAAAMAPGGPDLGPRALRSVGQTLPARLGTLLVEIRERSPKAHVVVTGYPHPGGPEPRGVLLGRREHAALSSFVDDLDDLVLEVARGQGATAVDVRARFDAAAATGQGWMQPLTVPLGHSFHPTEAGHRAYADAVVEAIDASGRPRPTPSTLRAGLTVPRIVSGPDRMGSGRRLSLSALALAGRRPPA